MRGRGEQSTSAPLTARPPSPFPASPAFRRSGSGAQHIVMRYTCQALLLFYIAIRYTIGGSEPLLGTLCPASGTTLKTSRMPGNFSLSRGGPMTPLLPILAFLFLPLAPSGPSSAKPDDPHLKNFENCLDLFNNCDLRQLSAAERNAVSQAHLDHNFQDCLDGFATCDSSKLDQAERALTERAAHDRNLSSCLSGIGECNERQLSPEERETVAEAQRIENLKSCLDSMFDCHTDRL